MEHLLPSALIIGIDHFAAKKLVEELVKKDISVVGVGDYVDGLNETKNFKWITNLDEVGDEFNYVFDFRGNKKDWQKESFKGEKINVICVDDEKKALSLKDELKNLDLNWRLVEAYGVYGAGMGEGWFLSNAFELAVKNKNLELPNLDQKFRLLAVADLVEAILRASFLSGTERENFLILGKETDSENVAKILIDEAKMTRLKVFQKEIDTYQGDKEKFLESQKKLRWSAEVEFKDGAKETLQYFFAKMDEESRSKKKASETVKNKAKDLTDIDLVSIKSEPRRKDFEVVVDEGEVVGEETVEEESEEFVDIPKFDLKKTKPATEDKIEEKEEEIIEEEDDEVKIVAENDEPVEVSETKKSKPKRIKFWGFLLIAAMVLMLAIPADWVVSTYLTIKNIEKVTTLIKNRKYVQAESLVNKNLAKIVVIDDKINDLSLNGLKLMRNYQLGLKVIEDLLEIEQKSITLAKSADLINEAVFKDKEINWETELAKIREGLVDLENKIGVLQARLNGDTSWLPSGLKMTVQKQMVNLQEVKSNLSLGVEVAKMIPEMLGLDNIERNYMVLFQNESELRPTGGFIGSYGMLTFKSGKLLALDIKDIYEADGQLKGHVEPPWEIKTYLNEASWYMRDANWNANFPTTAADIQWFLKKETNKKVNGVIGIDLAVAKAMLGVVGEIYVPDFKERINKDNLYDQAEFYTETKFFPGSNQKASFLGALGKQLFDEINNLKPDKRLEMLKVVLDLLQKNEIQLAFNNKDLMTTVANLGWDGSIYNGKCEVDNCVSDYLYVVEANLGVNKANYFLNRSFEQVVEIGKKNLGRVLKLSYENTAKNQNWPGGNYKNYVRVYLPVNTDILQIMVTDGNNLNAKKVYKQDEIRIREINGKKEVGFLMTVPVTKRRVVEIDYSTNIDLDNKKTFSYVNYIQKQPGTGETPMVNLITFPDDWQPTQVQPAASLVGGKLLFNQKLDRDIKMGVELGR